jgi:2,3-bisphosphoglycerate-independent phosphoglycerate mutase
MKKLLLIILDGWGIGPKNEHNAIFSGRTPFFDSLLEKNSRSILDASGEAVGLTEGQMGSSEVGHMHIGAGRVVMQELTRIDKSLGDGTFYTNEAFISACDYAKERKSALHLVGLLSDGGVHSHEKHLHALIKLARDQGIETIYVHAFLDGRDTPPASASRHLKRLEEKKEKAILRVGRISTGEIFWQYLLLTKD